MSSIEAMARNFQMQAPLPAPSAALSMLDVGGAGASMNPHMNPLAGVMSPITPTDIAAAAGGPQPEINEHTNEFDRLFTDGYFNDLTHDPVVQHDRRRQQPLPEP